MFTSGQITTILTSAENSLYRLQNQSELARYMDGDAYFVRQVELLYSLYESVTWGFAKGLTTSEFYGQVAYLYSKCQKALAGLTGVTTPSVPTEDDDSTTQTLVFLWEFNVQTLLVPLGEPNPIAGDTTWANSNFVNRTLEVEYGGVPVPGIEQTDGSVYFLKPYSGNTLRFYNLTGGLAAGALLKVRAWATGS